MSTTFGGARTPKILENKKNVHKSRDLGQLQNFIANVSRMDNAVDKLKMALSATIPATFDEENW